MSNVVLNADFWYAKFAMLADQPISHPYHSLRSVFKNDESAQVQCLAVANWLMTSDSLQ